MSGNPLTWLVNPRAPAESRVQIAEHYGLDKPVIIQYGHYVINMFRGDFGDSFVYNRPAIELILERVPATLELAGTALLLAIIMALPIGVYSAVKRGRFTDILGRIFAFMGISAPSFWLGLMGIYLFAVKAKKYISCVYGEL
jgi:peptide/nickel transport system permease protein